MLQATLLSAGLCATACSHERSNQQGSNMSTVEPAAAGRAAANGGAGTPGAGAPETKPNTSGIGAAGANAGTAPVGGGRAGMPAPATAGAGGESRATSGAGAGARAVETSGVGGTVSPGACTRELLKTTVDLYFTALEAHAPEMLPRANHVKFTENGKPLDLGEGLWKSAGPVKFKESLFDAQQCGTVTQAVVPEGSTDLPFALRLALEGQQITQIETIAVRSGDYTVASNTRNMLALMNTPWESVVPEDQRATREQLVPWIDKYFRMFPMGGCNLADDCKRMENGFTLACTVGATCSRDAPSGSPVMTPRIILADVEAGLAAGFVMFQGRYTDVHMIKHVGGQVLGVHTILGEAASSGWD